MIGSRKGEQSTKSSTIKKRTLVASTALVFAVLGIVGIGIGTNIQYSAAQYGDTGATTTTTTPGLSKETLQLCTNLKIPLDSCNQNTTLKVQSVQSSGNGSGKPLLATELGQMLVLIGAIGAIFGGVAGAFFVKGRSDRNKITV